MNINIRNKISFFEVHWDMNMQLVRDQIYYNAPRALQDLNSYYTNAPQKIFYFLNVSVRVWGGPVYGSNSVGTITTTCMDTHRLAHTTSEKYRFLSIHVRPINHTLILNISRVLARKYPYNVSSLCTQKKIQISYCTYI